ncbi:MAG: adenylyl-sulfate reductase subunit alpha [Thermoguttaceae bacterium]|nr:adenylyl-sulfate reductase subunit alpha [Thermoguttaceae bacterium]
MKCDGLRLETLRADVLIVGGGAAGCYAAITAARINPDLRIIVLEKANVKRSGCLAAGVNAINAYIVDGHTEREYLEYVRWDAEKIIRDDLVLSMAKRFNSVARDLEHMGLVILKDENGNYISRGKRNIKINGENIKPILASELARYENISVINHVNVTDLIVDEEGVRGAVGFSVNFEAAFLIAARVTLVATGGAAGLYRPNNPGFSRHKMWYPPFNTGAGYAMGARIGAEMTTFEMRFVAQRCKDTIAPTGTIALGVGAQEVNGLGEAYASRYGLSTSGRAQGATSEALAGRGPCYLKTVGVSSEQEAELCRAYLNMAPAQTLKWLESGQTPSLCNVEIEGTEPYIVGGHTGSGYWIDTSRRTTIAGLYAAGDVAGGAPKKFVTGAMAEGAIAAETMIDDLSSRSEVDFDSLERLADEKIEEYSRRLTVHDSVYDVFDLEEAMQKTMDAYAGGISAKYRYNDNQLDIARKRVAELTKSASLLSARDMDELLHIYELVDRLTVCETVIAHLKARRETRWPGFGVNANYPEKNDEWEFFVNSRRRDGVVEIVTRPLTLGKEWYEHTN